MIRSRPLFLLNPKSNGLDFFIWDCILMNRTRKREWEKEIKRKSMPKHKTDNIIEES